MCSREVAPNPNASRTVFRFHALRVLIPNIGLLTPLLLPAVSRLEKMFVRNSSVTGLNGMNCVEEEPLTSTEILDSAEPESNEHQIVARADRELTAKTKPKLTGRQICRWLFIACEAMAIGVTLLLSLSREVFLLDNPLASIPVMVLPFLSVAMLVFHYWIAGITGLVTTVVTVFFVIESAVARGC